MRHILEFLHFRKRDEKKSKKSHAQLRNVDPAATLVVAGEPIPRESASRSRPAPQIESEKVKTPAPRLAEVVAAKRRDNWRPPELEGPEFGGLIERRGVDKGGLMPKKFTPEVHDEHRKAPAAADAARPASGAAVPADQSLESTGMFLAALDNSAITLADSGLFKVSSVPDDAPEQAPASFDPYDKKVSD